jgi:hypothetical protein
MEKVGEFTKNKLKNMSDFKIYTASFFMSGFMAYRYGKNRFMYMEHNGHFNSAQNMLNKNLLNFHLQEVFVRFTIGSIICIGVLIATRSYLGGTQSVKEESVKSINVEEYSKDFVFEDIVRDNVIVTNSFDHNDSLRRKRIVENLINHKQK